LARRAALWALIALALAAPAYGEPPAVARAFARGGEDALGNVFFVAHEGEAVAVGAAHSLDGTALAEAGELEFRVAGDPEPVAASSRYYAAPGVAFHRSGASLAGDYVIFKLVAPPRGVRVLALSAARPEAGERVRIIGVAQQGGAPAVIEGLVALSEPDRIEVDLAGFEDLRGWGGAPVLDEGEGRVVGLLQSARPRDAGLRIGVGPIAGVATALSEPFEDGLGRLFTTLAPPPSAANDSASRRRRATGSPFGTLDPRLSAARVRSAALLAVREQGPERAEVLVLEVERPTAGEVLGTANAFVAGHALGLQEGRRRFDVMLVLDTSLSTGEPAGVDVDGDGEVGQTVPLETRRMLDPGSTDPDDSILAAEIAAAERLLEGLDPRTTRVGIVTFAGEPAGPPVLGPRGMRINKAAITQEPLTSDFRRLRVGLERVQQAGSAGMTHMAAGVDLAVLELLGLEGSVSRPLAESEKVILFFTDGEPTLPYTGDAPNVRAVLGSAQRARQTGVRIHSFAIGPGALARPIAPVEMAAISEGVFTPVRHPATLSEFMEYTSFARVESVDVTNATSDRPAYAVRLHPDGSFDALVPLEAGENELVVRARTPGGDDAIRRVRVRYTEGVGEAPMPVELVSKHNRLLEMRLESIQNRRLEIVRRELILEMETERKAALERAETQRKELDLRPAPN